MESPEGWRRVVRQHHYRVPAVEWCVEAVASNLKGTRFLWSVAEEGDCDLAVFPCGSVFAESASAVSWVELL